MTLMGPAAELRVKLWWMFSVLGLSTCVTTTAALGLRVADERQAVRPFHAVIILDSSVTSTMGVTPFAWDGNGSPRDGFVTGRRPPDRPFDVFMLPLLDGLFPTLIEEDRVQLWSVSRSLRKSAAFTGSRRDLRSAARDILAVPDRDRFGPAPVWDAVVEATEVLSRVPGRRVVLVVSTGMVSGNRVGLDSTIKAAVDRRVPVWIIQLPWVPSTGPGFQISDSSASPWVVLRAMFGPDPTSLLRKLASETGGGMYGVDLKTNSLRRGFYEVIALWRR